MRRAGWLAAAVAAVVVLGYGAADAADVVPGVLTTQSTPAVTATPAVPDPPRPSLTPPLAPLSTEAPVPTADGVARVLDPLLDVPALGPGTAASVLDAATGQVLLDRASAVAHVPASTAKLLTGAAVLSTVGGSTTLPTRVVQGATPDEVVLVGGGDVLLGTGRSRLAETSGHAGLATLAAQVASALAKNGVQDVAVRFDDGLFEGPTLSPAWNASDVGIGFVGHVTALGLASDVPRLYHPGPADPSAAAARAFVRALKDQGVRVTGTVARTRATKEAPVLGEVRSAPVQDVLALTLSRSDNTLAEVLARLASHAMGRPTTAQDAPIAVMEAVQRLGVDVGDAHLADGSGLGDGSEVPSRVLAHVLVLAAQQDESVLRPLLTGLPVAGLTGTLAARYRAGGTHAAAGAVRAKTGTLTGVNSLAGTTVDDDGRLLVFVVMSDRVPAHGSTLARRASDRIATALTACGCR